MNSRFHKAVMAGAATLALIAAPLALAQGNGNRGNGGGGGQKSERPQSGGGEVRGNHGNGRDGGGSQRPDSREQRGNSGGNGGRNAERGPDRGPDRSSADRGNERAGGNGSRGNGRSGDDRGNGSNRGNGNADRRDSDRGMGNGNGGGGNRRDDGGLLDIDLDVDFALPALRQAYGIAPRVIDGCPPGLAKKRNGCLPPGQARQAYRRYDPGFFGLFGTDRGNYFYDGGYLLRYGGDGLAGYIPLLGGALGIGEVWPSFYEPRPLPNYYRDYYGLGEPAGYRYADNVIYRIDPESAAILGVAALLTGDDITIGQPMPRGYDIYNVPHAYRDRYYDRPGRRYRYADGYVYEIDTETALVIAAIRLAS